MLQYNDKILEFFNEWIIMERNTVNSRKCEHPKVWMSQKRKQIYFSTEYEYSKTWTKSESLKREDYFFIFCLFNVFKLWNPQTTVYLFVSLCLNLFFIVLVYVCFLPRLDRHFYCVNRNKRHYWDQYFILNFN